MNTEIKLLDRIYNLCVRKANRVKGYCYYCGNPLFDLKKATRYDENGMCIFCREAELRGERRVKSNQKNSQGDSAISSKE